MGDDMGYRQRRTRFTITIVHDRTVFSKGVVDVIEGVLWRIKELAGHSFRPGNASVTLTKETEKYRD